MSELLVDFFSILDEVTPECDEGILRETMAAWRELAGISGIRQAVHRWLEHCADQDKLRMRARETSTHYVWPLHTGSNGVSVAINEFKDPADMVKGYATIYHNHRYSFASLMLSGGYRETRSRINFVNPGETAQINDLRQESIAVGGIVKINHQEFHRLNAISARTVTLVVKCPIMKSASFSVDSGTLRVTRHLPVEERVPQLMAALVPDE